MLIYQRVTYTGWWLSHPSEKYESQLGLFFPIYGKIKNVPNHQSVYNHQPYAFQTVAMWGTYFQLGTSHKTIPHNRPYMTNIKRRGCVRDPTHNTYITICNPTQIREFYSCVFRVPLIMKVTGHPDPSYEWEISVKKTHVACPIKLPPAKHTKNYGKSPCLMGKLTINGHCFNSFSYVYQAGY